MSLTAESPQCDQLRPGCTQCSKISIPCTGYRDQLDLRFRDETALVARKVQSHQQTISQDSRKKSGNGHDPSIEISGIYLKISNPLQQPLQDVAINHFLGSYVQGSHFEYLPQIYTNASLATPLAASSCASAIASLSRELREPEIMKVARQFYGRALKMINAALQSPQDAPLDGTLVSVLLLGLFETVNQDKKPSPESWTTHTEGAVALLKMRGPEQFETELGKKLFVQVSNNIRVSCFQRSLRLPTQFVELDKIAAMHLDMENPILRFWPIIDNFIELQADLLDGTILETPAVIETAMNIDDQAWKLSTSMPQSWRYEELSRDAAPAGAYEQTAHLYPDHVVARLWSTIRMTRIYLHEIIHEHAGFIMAASSSVGRYPRLLGRVTDYSKSNRAEHGSSISSPASHSSRRSRKM